jgi:hypothetical protein
MFEKIRFKWTARQGGRIGAAIQAARLALASSAVLAFAACAGPGGAFYR